MSDRNPQDFDTIANMLEKIMRDTVFIGEYPPTLQQLMELCGRINEVFFFAKDGGEFSDNGKN